MAHSKQCSVRLGRFDGFLGNFVSRFCLNLLIVVVVCLLPGAETQNSFRPSFLFLFCLDRLEVNLRHFKLKV